MDEKKNFAGDIEESEREIFLTFSCHCFGWVRALKHPVETAIEEENSENFDILTTRGMNSLQH